MLTDNILYHIMHFFSTQPLYIVNISFSFLLKPESQDYINQLFKTSKEEVNSLILFIKLYSNNHLKVRRYKLSSKSINNPINFGKNYISSCPLMFCFSFCYHIIIPKSIAFITLVLFFTQ